MEMRLSPNHERAVSIRLRVLEERLALVRYLMDVDEQGVLYRRDHAEFTPDQRTRIESLMATLHAEIAGLAEALRLRCEDQDAAGKIVGLLAMTWQSLGDIRARSLRGHGEVDPGLAERLDPAVERLMDLVLRLERAAAREPGRESSDQRGRRRPAGRGRRRLTWSERVSTLRSEAMVSAETIDV